MSLIETAIRNALVIRWFRACDPLFAYAVRCLYAAETGIPDRELGSDDLFIQDPDVIEWAAARFAGTIALYGEDEL